MSYFCQFCQREMTTVRDYISHYKLHSHVKNIRFPCCFSNCQSCFTHLTSLKSHISRNHSLRKALPSVENTNSGVISCTVGECHVTLNNWKDIIAHTKIHIDGVEPVLCPFPNCNGKFNIKSSFSSHVSRKHSYHNLFRYVSCSETVDTGTCTLNSDLNDVDMSVELTDEVNISNASIVNNSDFTRHMALFLMRLEADYLVPVSTINLILSDVSFLHKLSLSMLQNEFNASSLTPNVKLNDLVRNDILCKLLSSGEKNNFMTNFQRKKYFKSHFKYVEPVEINLGLNGSNRQSVYHYVPIIGTLEALVTNKSIKDQLDNPPQPSAVDVFSDVIHGHSFTNNEYFVRNPSALKLLLYQDAFELVNPLGSARKVFKILAFYFTILDIHPHNRSQLHGLQLALLCKETDYEYFGDKILEALLTDLKKLSAGVFIGDTIFLKGNIACILGDNLGSHLIGGFLTNFGNSDYFCRYCTIQRENFENNCLCYREVSFRTKESYDRSVENLNENYIGNDSGVKSHCIFNELEGFHVVNPGLPPCIGHDLFEGVIKYDLGIFLKELTGKYKWCTVKQLNFRISSLQLKGSDSGNRPALLKADLSLKGHAVQNWTFLRFLPIILGDFIKDVENDIWNLILLLRQITELTCSYKISSNQIAVLQNLIDQYIDSRQQLFPDQKLRPKHHYMQHYPWLITQFGPLLHVWTMRFESKHTYFKRCIRNTKNFINVTKSLAEKHQLLQAYIHSGDIFSSGAISENVTEVEITIFSREIAMCINNRFPGVKSMKICNSFKLNEICIMKDMVVVIDASIGTVTFGKIELCLMMPGDNMYLLCKYFEAERSEFGVYEVENAICTNIVHVNDLTDPFPLNVYNLFDKSVVALKGSSFDPMM